MLFLMGVLALLLTTPNANADDKEKYKLFAEETRTSNPQLSSSASFLRLNVLSSLN